MLLETFKYPHPNQGGRPNALLVSKRPQPLERIRIEADGDPGRETLGKANADRCKLLLVVRGAVSIPECCLFLDARKLGDTAGF